MVDALMMKSMEPGGVHHGLLQMVGDWEGLAHTWFAPGPPSDESTWTGSIRSLLGGRFLLHSYHGMIQGKTLEGCMLIGVQLKPQRAQMAWIDSFHNGAAMMLCEGEAIEKGVSVLGHYGAPPGPKWGWRTDIVLDSDLALRIVMTNIPPEGEGDPAKAVEVLYQRKN